MGILANRPVIRATAAAAVQAAVAAVREQRSTGRAAPMPPVEANATVVQATAERIAAQPTLVNAMNAEPLWQSRVFVGLVISVVTMVARWLGLEISVSASDTDIIMQALPLVGLAIAAIGRTVKGLPPIVWRRPWTLLGIGR